MLDILIGKLHVLILHLPIGVLLLVIAFEWFAHWKWLDVSRNVLTWCYGIGAGSALLACFTGYLLSTTGDYGTSLVEDHKWAGIVTSIVTIAVFYCSWKKEYPFQRWLSLLILFGITITGHLGGQITHGSDYFSFAQSESNEYQPPVYAISTIDSTTLIYRDIIHPILQSKCVGCHGPSKMKGKLRLDDPFWISKGGKSGNPVISEKRMESELIHRIELDVVHDDHMPPRQKEQLSTDEIDLIIAWISNGGSFIDPIIKYSAAKELVALGNRVIQTSGITGNHKGSTIPAFLPRAKVSIPLASDLENLRRSGIVALPAGKDSPFLELNYINISSLNEEHWQYLNKVAPNVTKLKLSHHEVEDKHLRTISQMKNLLSLFLDHTSITDVGLQHLSSLSELRYLNLNNTKVSGEGILSLLSLPNLEKIYVYNTIVDPDSIATDIQIIRGGFDVPILSTDTIRIPEN